MGGTAAGSPSGRRPPPTFGGWYWRFGNALVSAFARAGVGPMALLTTTGRVTGQSRTVPVVPVDHAGQRWLVAPYGPVSWVRNVRANPTVVLRYGRRRHVHTVREVGPDEAGPVLKRYVAIATRTRSHFVATADAPVEAFVAEASAHPVFALDPGARRVPRPGSA